MNMFKKSENKQFDLFTSSHLHLSDRKLRGLEDKTGWHHIFWSQLVSKIDEHSYAILFDDRMGRPNASIRILIGMMILKEANGWSDEQLFDECTYNLRVQAALGIQDLKDDTPGPTAYYDLRKRLVDHSDKTGEDLIAQTFSQVTSEQVSEFNISGEKIRLDSKLIQSNIAKTTRLQMIIEAVRVTLKGRDISRLKSIVTKNQYEILEQLPEKSTTNITYSVNRANRERMLVDMGYIIHALIKLEIIGSEDILFTIYQEQYSVEAPNDSGSGNLPSIKIEPQENSKISSGSIQSIHDPEAAYRNKGEKEAQQIIHGYHSNICESCTEDDELNLILEVNTERANVSEADMLIPAINKAQEVLGAQNEIKEAITDGGYDGIENRKAFQEENMPSWQMHKLKGGVRAFDMKYVDEELIVTETKTGEPCEVSWSERSQKIIIKEPNVKQARYFTEDQIIDYILALEIVGKSTAESYNLRANVESSIHQLFHRLKKRQKIVYRGLTKCHWYVLSRAFWVNISRINEYLKGMELNTSIFHLLVTRVQMMLVVLNLENKINQILHQKNIRYVA